jgi:F0F1-type ATP synthase beta subunit
MNRPNTPPHPPDRPADVPAAPGIDPVAVYRQILRIVAHLQGTPYTDIQKRQTVGLPSDDLADPASANDTAQG